MSPEYGIFRNIVDDDWLQALPESCRVPVHNPDRKCAPGFTDNSNLPTPAVFAAVSIRSSFWDFTEYLDS
jgi:hypothetical protein